MTKYFKRKQPISYQAKVAQDSLTVYFERFNNFEVYADEDEQDQEGEELGDYNFNKYSEEE